MPDFVFQSPGGFTGNFEVAAAPGYTPSQDEQAYLACLSACIRSVSDLTPRNRKPESAELQQQKAAVRDRAVGVLRKRAEDFAARPRGADRDLLAQSEIPETYRIEGRYREWMARIEATPFTVVPVERLDNPRLNCDLRIDARDVNIPDDPARLKTEIDNALTVTRVVFAERESSVPWVLYLVGRHKRRVEAVQHRWHEYIEQLLGIARVGLMNTDPTQAPFARQDLVRYKNEFTMREAGAVKNHYVRRLGAVCFFAVVILMLLYVLARRWPAGTVPHDFRNFFILAAGAVCGTWLSFLLRRASLSFEDLAVLEEDQLNPSIRVLFMIGLSAVIGLLFWTQAVIFVLGDFQSGPAIYNHGAWTLLLGLLAGIAERALGTAVARRAEALPAAVGGTTQSAIAQH